MIEHPETRGEVLISPAVQDILVEQFRDALAFGTPDYPDGTSERYEESKDLAYKALVTAIQTDKPTFVAYLMMHAYEIAAETDPARLRKCVVSLGGTVVQWIDAIDARGV